MRHELRRVLEVIVAQALGDRAVRVLLDLVEESGTDQHWIGTLPANVDADAKRAVELGATLQRPPQDQFYGDRDGYVIDPFGHGWTIATHVEDVAPEEMARRMAELYGQA
jgi:uncharacterized glyoxalase superfamily protein PhnB